MTIKELLSNILDEDQMKDFDIDADLNTQQKCALEKFKISQNLLIIGQAGCGKSKCIKTMFDYNFTSFQETHYKKMYLCATTGVAAYNIGGMTIHSFLGIGTGEQDIQFLIRKVQRNKNIAERLRTDHILVIDEISMMSASLFEKINILYKTFRRNNNFFGGIQVILVGDFLQTECIFNEKIHRIDDKRLLIESPVFLENFTSKNTVQLTENFRQKGDTFFQDLLSRIRIGKPTSEDLALLRTKCVNFQNELNKLPKDINPVYLVSSNAAANSINSRNIEQIQQAYTHYNCIFSEKGPDSKVIEMLKKELEHQLKIRGLTKLSLKKGCRIMLIRNIDTDLGLINGSLGSVLDLNSSSAYVAFDNGIKTWVGMSESSLELDGCVVKVNQLPLILSYSITIHKSLSLTLDHAIMDLKSCFCNHMVYVAMSRVKSLDTLFLKSFDPSKVTVNQKILKYLEASKSI
jgi:ATP-dependent DNA helicase PIF1